MDISLFESATVNGMKIDTYSLRGGNVEVRAMTYGASLTGIFLPGADGGRVNILLSLEDAAAYVGNDLYLNCALAPNAGRIGSEGLIIDGRTFTLTRNDGMNNHHGGPGGMAHMNTRLYQVSADSASASITFMAELEDGRDGYPGDRVIKVTYKLGADDSLTLSFEGESSKDTYLNLSSHPYFNMSGDFTSCIHDSILSVNADMYVETDEANLPAGLKAVAGTPFDYRGGRSISSNLIKYPDHGQIKNGGIDHPFVLNSDKGGAPDVTLEDPSSGRRLELYTDTPAVVLYSGGMIGGGYALSGGIQSQSCCALAIEPQDIPNVTNNRLHHVNILRAGEIYKREFTYKFYYQ